MGSLRNWEILIPSYENCILFFDESCSYTFSKEFTKIVQESSCYFVFITRRVLKTLPYSIEDIYRIHESGKYV